MPVITDDQIAALIAAEKPAGDRWHGQSTPTRRDGANLRGSYDLPDPVKLGALAGTFAVFTRQNLSDASDFTAGLSFTDSQGHRYRLVRCNQHPPFHPNRIEGTRIEPGVPHIHIATERYIRLSHEKSKFKHDGFATVTDAYGDLAGAIDHLSKMVNLSGAGRLFL